VANGTRVEVRLSARSLRIINPREEFVWAGETKFVNFDVEVPDDAPLGDTTLKFDVLVEGFPIIRLRLMWKSFVRRLRKEQVSPLLQRRARPLPHTQVRIALSSRSQSTRCATRPVWTCSLIACRFMLARIAKTH
jgi:hypothetical protein